MQLFFYMDMDDISRTQLFRLFQVLIEKLEIKAGLLFQGHKDNYSKFTEHD